MRVVRMGVSRIGFTKELHMNKTRTIIVTCLLAVSLLLVSGCGKCPIFGGGDSDTAEVKLCSSCGQTKGSDACCKAGAAKCANCGKDKGSPGCCK